MTKRQSHAPGKPEPGKKEGFKQKPGLRERWKKKREPAKVAKLLKSACLHPNGSSREKMEEALEIFKGLDPEQQERPLREIEGMLKKASRYTWESGFKILEVHLLADFLTEAAKHLPKNEAGDPVTEPFEDILFCLADVVEARGPEQAHEDYPQMRISCTRALWELAYPSYDFWQGRILDPVTNDAAIGFMLEMPPTENPEEHGWHLLEQNLGDIGPAVAGNDSPAKVEFLKYVLSSDKTKTLLAAVRTAATLDKERDDVLMSQLEQPGDRQHIILGELIKMYQSGWDRLLPTLEKAHANAGEAAATDDPGQRLNALLIMSGLESVGVAEKKAPSEVESMIFNLLEQDDQASKDVLMEHFLRAGPWMAWSRSENKAKFFKEMVSDPDVADQVLMMAYQSGNAVVQDAVAAALLDMPDAETAENHGWCLLEDSLDIMGLAVASCESPRKIDFIKSLVERDKAETVTIGFQMAALLEEGREVFDSIANEMLVDKDKKKFWAAAKEFRIVHRLIPKLEEGGDAQIQAIGSFVPLLASGKEYLLPHLDKVQEKMNLLLIGGNLDEQLHALFVLGQLSMIGIGEMRSEDEIKTFVDNRLEEDDDESYAVLRDNVSKVGLVVAKSPLEGKIGFISRMLSEDVETARKGLEVALYLEELPDELSWEISAIGEDESKKELHNAVKEFFETIKLKQELEMADERQFKAAHTAIDLYSQGRSYLAPLLLEISMSMADIFANPGGETPEQDAKQKQEAVNVIVHLAMVGVRTPVLDKDGKAVGTFNVKFQAPKASKGAVKEALKADVKVAGQVGELLQGLAKRSGESDYLQVKENALPETEPTDAQDTGRDYAIREMRPKELEKAQRTDKENEE
jgi:hypothetical protein